MVMAAMLLVMPGTDAQAAKVKMSKPSMTLKAGQSRTLKLKNAVGKVKWTSSKKSVASVTKKGKVTARKAGSALIWAQAKGHTYRCSVTVVNAAKKDTADTDVTNTDSADTDTSATDTQATTEDTQPDKTETKPVHEHTWVPHYTYGADGKPRKDAMFCSDVTCPYNNGYGTDNGWRGESLTDNTGTGATEPSQGTSVQQPAAPVTGNTGNTQDTVTTKPDVTEPAATENPVQEEQPKEEHHHDYNVPIMSNDGLRVEGYACACGEKASHNHEWTEAVYRTEGYGAGYIVECYKCPCGETITVEGYVTLYENNKKASEEIIDNWVAQNITAGMTEEEKVKAVVAELRSWTYGHVENTCRGIIERKGVCETGNKALILYCEAMGIHAELTDSMTLRDIGDMDYSGLTHVACYVWIDGIQCFTDATPEGSPIVGGNDIWSMEQFSLWLQCNNEEISSEEYNERLDELRAQRGEITHAEYNRRTQELKQQQANGAISYEEYCAQIEELNKQMFGNN